MEGRNPTERLGEVIGPPAEPAAPGEPAANTPAAVLGRFGPIDDVVRCIVSDRKHTSDQ